MVYYLEVALNTNEVPMVENEVPAAGLTININMIEAIILLCYCC